MSNDVWKVSQLHRFIYFSALVLDFPAYSDTGYSDTVKSHLAT